MLRIEKRIIQFGIFDDDNENDWIEEVVEENPTNQQAEKDVWNDTDSPFEVENNNQQNGTQQQFQQQTAQQMNAAQQNYMQQQAYIMQQQQMQAQQIARQQAYQEAVKKATTINPATKKEPMSKKTKIILGSTVGGGLALLAILSGVAYVGVAKSKQRAIINGAKNDFEKASAEIQEYIDSNKKNKDKQYTLKVIDNLEKSLVEIKGKYSQLVKNIKDPNNFKKEVEIFVANLKNNHSSAKSSIVDLETQYFKYKLIKDKYEEIIKNMKNADSSEALYGPNDLYKFYSETNKEESLYFRITNPNSELSIANKVFSAGTTKKEAEEAVDKLNARWPKWKSELENFKDLYVSMLKTKKSLEFKEKDVADQAIKELVKKQIQEISSLLDLTNKDRDYVSWETWINQPQVLTTHNLKYYEELINGDENKIKEFSEFLLKYVTPTLEAIKNLHRKARVLNKYKDFCDSMERDYTNFTKKSQPYSFDSLEDVKKFDAEVKSYYNSKNKEFEDMISLFSRLEKLNKLVNDFIVDATPQTKFKEIFEKAKLYNVNEIVNNSVSLDNFKPFEHYKWYLSIKDNVAQYPNTEMYAVLAKTMNRREQYLRNIFRSNNNNLEKMQSTYTDFSSVFKKAIEDICKFEEKRNSTLVAINNTEQWINSLTNFNSYNYDEFRKELRQKLDDDKAKVNNFMDYSEIENFVTFEKYFDFYTKSIENVTTSNQDVEKNYKYREQVFKKNIDDLKQLENAFSNNIFLSQPNSFSKYTIYKNALSKKVQDLLKNKDNSLTFTNLKNGLSNFQTEWTKILQGHTELKTAYDALKKAIEDSSLTLNQLQTEFEFLFTKLTQAKLEAQNDYDNSSSTLDKEFYDNARNTLISTISTINGQKVEYQKLVDKIDQEIGTTESEGYKKIFNQYKEQPYLKVQTQKLFDLYTTNSVSVKKDLKKVSLDQAKQDQIKFLNQLSSVSNEITTRFEIHEQLDQKIKEITNKLQTAEFKIEPKTTYSYLGQNVKNYLDLAIASLAKNDEANDKWTEYINGLNSKWENAVQTYQNHKKAIEDLQALIEQYKATISSTTNNSSNYKDELFNVIRTEENAYAENVKNLTLNVDTTLAQIQEKTVEITNKKAKILTETGEFALHKVAFDNFNVEINKFENIFNQTETIHNKLVSNFGTLSNNSFADLRNKNSNIKNTNDNFKFTKTTTKTSEYQQKIQGIKNLISTSQNEIDARIAIYTTLNTNLEQTNEYLASLQDTSPVKFIKANRQTKFNKHKQEFVTIFTTIPNNYNENNQISEKITNYFIKSQWETKVNQLIGFGNLIITNWNTTKQVYDEIVEQQNNTSETLSLNLEAITKHNVDKIYPLFKDKKIENNIQINPFDKEKLIETLLAQDNNESFTLFNQYATYFEKSGNFLAKKDVDLELKKLWVTKFTKEIAIKEIKDEITNNNNFYQITNDYFGLNQQRNTNAFIKEKLDKFLRIREFEQIKDNSFEDIKAFSQEYTKELFNKIKKTREDIEALNAKSKWINIKDYLLKYYIYSKYSGNYPNENNIEITKLNDVITEQNYINKNFQIKDLEPATAWFTKSNQLLDYLKTIVISEQNISSTTQKTFDAYLEYYKTETLKQFNEFFGMQNSTLTNVHKFILKDTAANAINLSEDFEGIISSFKSFNKINNIDNTHLYNSEFLSNSNTKIVKWQNDFINKIEENISKDLNNLNSTSNLWTMYYSSVDAVSTFKETLRNYMNTYNEFKVERDKFKVALDNLNGYLENLKKLKEFVNTHNYFGDVKTEIDSHYNQLEAKYQLHLKGYNEDYKNKSKVVSETQNIQSFISTVKNKNNEIATKIEQQINTCIWSGSSNTYAQFDQKLNELNKYFQSDLTKWFEKINYLFSSIEEAKRFKTMVLNFAISKFHLLNKFNEGSYFADILGIDQNNDNNSFTWLSKVMNELNTLKKFSLNSILENQDKKFIIVENNNSNITNAMGRSISAINFLNTKGENLTNSLKPVYDLFEAIFNEFNSIDVLGEVNDSILKSKIYTFAIKDEHIHSKDLELNKINVNSNNILNIITRTNTISKRNDVKGEVTLKSVLKIQINNSMSSNTFEINKEQIKSGFFKLGEKNGQEILVSDILVGENLNLYAKNYNSGRTSEKGIFTQKVKRQDEWTLYDGTNNLDRIIDSPYKYLWNKNSNSPYNRKIVVKENENKLSINNSSHFYPSITYYDEQGNQKTIEFTDLSKKYSSININTLNTTTNYEENVKKVKRYHREFLKYYSMLSALFQENISNSLYELKNDYEVRKMYILLKLFFDSINHKTLEVLDNHTLNYVLAEIFGITNEVFTNFKNKLDKFKTELPSLLNSNSSFKIFDISAGKFETRYNLSLTSFVNETNKYIFAINNGNKAENLLNNYIYSNPSSEEIIKAVSSFINTEEGFSEHFIFKHNNKKFISNCIFNNEHQVSFDYSANSGQMNEVYIINSDISTLSIDQNVDKIVIKNSKVDTLKFKNNFKEIEAINSTISEIDKTNSNNYISVQKIMVDNTNFNDNNFIKLINETSIVQYNKNGFDLYLDNIYEEIDLSKMIKTYQLNEWNNNLFDIDSVSSFTGDDAKLSVNNIKFNDSTGFRQDINTSSTGYSKIKSFVANNSYLKRTDLLKYTNPYVSKINVNNHSNSSDTVFVKKIKNNNFDQFFNVEHSDINQVAVQDEIKSKQYLFAELKEYNSTFTNEFEVIKFEVHDQKYNFDFIVSRLEKLLLKNSFIEGENIINELSTDIKLIVNEKIRFYNELLSVGTGNPTHIEFNHRYKDNGENSNIKEEINRWLATKFFKKKSQNKDSINSYYNCWMGLSDQIGINTLEFTGNFINKEFTHQNYKTISNSNDWNDVTTHQNNSEHIKGNIKY